MTTLDFDQINSMEVSEIEKWLLNRLLGRFDIPLHQKKDPNPVGIFGEIVESAKSNLETRLRFANCILNTFVRVLADRSPVEGVDLRNAENVINLSEVASLTCVFAAEHMFELASRTVRDEIISPSFNATDEVSMAIGRCYLSFEPSEEPRFWNALGTRGGNWEKIAFQGLAINSPLDAFSYMSSLNYPEELMRVVKFTAKRLINKHGLSLITDHIRTHFQISEDTDAHLKVEQYFGITPKITKGVGEILDLNTRMLFPAVYVIQQRRGKTKLDKALENARKHLTHVSFVFKSPVTHFDAIEGELRKSIMASVPGRNANPLAPTQLAAACFSVDPVFWLLTGMVFRFPDKCDSLNGWFLDIDTAEAFAEGVESGADIVIGSESIGNSMMQSELRSFYEKHCNFFYGGSANETAAFRSVSPLLATLLVLQQSSDIRNHLQGQQ